MRRFVGLLPVAVFMLASVTLGQTMTIHGKDLALRCSGRPEGHAWVLERNGYVGTYVRMAQPGRVSVSVDTNASDLAAMSVVVADEKLELKSNGKRALEFALPAGVWLVRIDRAGANPDAIDPVTIRRVAIEGAEVLNEHSDAHALAAAASYIEHFRKGPAVVMLPNVSAGDQVQVKLRRHAFLFGTAVAGFENNQYLIKDAPSDSDAARYQTEIRRLFNAIVPGNAGKWEYNERERGVVTMGYIDEIIEFARDNDLRMRMHTLIWDTGQQPEWTRDLLAKAADGDEDAKKDLRAAISRRIEYYVRDRTHAYTEMDVLNEVYHEPRYLQIFGIDGLADIYAEAGRAVREAGADTRLFINEYNVFQWSQLPHPFGDKEAWDPYANWLREHAEALRGAGATVDGIGVQYYVNPDPELAQPHSPARIFAALQNLSVGGWPITLTEFGASTAADEALAAEALDHTVRLVFGTPNANGFFMWGIWQTEMWDRALGAAFFDKQWNPRQPLRRWEALMSELDTEVTVVADEGGAIRFTGFYGDYDITVGDRVFPLTLEKGRTQYSIEARQ